MNYYNLHQTQFINKPISEVFNFFSMPENLEVITPGYLNFRIKTPSPVKMESGRIIDYKIKLRGVPFTWSSLISEYDPPYKFIDEQVRGPYAYWHHTHIFSETKEGTLIEDIVKYSIPFGLAGQFAHFLFIKSDLKNIFQYRFNTINKIFKN